jgi:hypothetical protein
VRPGNCSRNISAFDTPQHAPKSKPETPSTALISAVQWTCIFTVLGVQAGLVVERIQKQTANNQRRVGLSPNAVNNHSPKVTLSEFSQYQPLLLAIGVACAMLTKRSTDRYKQIHTACKEFNFWLRFLHYIYTITRFVYVINQISASAIVVGCR